MSISLRYLPWGWNKIRNKRRGRNISPHAYQDQGHCHSDFPFDTYIFTLSPAIVLWMLVLILCPFGFAIRSKRTKTVAMIRTGECSSIFKA